MRDVVVFVRPVLLVVNGFQMKRTGLLTLGALFFFGHFWVTTKIRIDISWINGVERES